MILVTGASGFIGLHLVRALAAEGKPVRALVRSDEGEAKVRVAAPSAETFRGHLGDVDSLQGAAEGCGLVYHLAGSYRGSPAELHSSHVAGTARVLRALEPTARMVMVSSTSVYGWEREWPADHATPPRPTSAYGKAKLAAERLVLARPEANVVVARPTITYGPGDTEGMLARAAGMLAHGPRFFPGSGDNRIHLLHVDDLVAALLLLGDKGDGVYVLAGPEARPLRDILALLAASTGLPRARFGLPASALRPVARGLETAWSLTGHDGEAPVSVHSLDVACRDRAYSSARAADELGWRPQVTLEDGLSRMGAWLASSGTIATGPMPSPAARNGAVMPVTPEAPPPSHGFEWRSYFADADEGLGTVYERFALQRVLESAMAGTGSTSVLHAPLFGMLGVPGLDAVFLARSGVRVGLLDFDADRFEAVRGLWSGYGLTPETHEVGSSNPAEWPERLPASYDLVFSFAALWWFDDPWAVLAAQARWARKGVLVCVPNRNVFMRLRSLAWHRDLFQDLNQEALDPVAMTEAAERVGLKPVDTGLFDIPPFPDTSVPLAKVVRRMLGSRRADGPVASNNAAAWRWSILPYLEGADPGLADRVERFTPFERHLPAVVAPHLAHHRYILFVPESTPADDDASSPAMAATAIP